MPMCLGSLSEDVLIMARGVIRVKDMLDLLIVEA